MYEIRCIVGDKKLREVLLALRNQTLMAPTVTPVGEDTPFYTEASKASRPEKKTKMKTTIKNRGGFRKKGEGVIQVIRPLIEHVEHISAREMKAAANAAGYRPGAYSHAVKILMDEGAIKPLGFGHYEVLKKGSYEIRKTSDHAA